MLIARLTLEDLPSFLWLWRIAAWSMGWSVAIYFGLAVLGLIWRSQRLALGVKPLPWIRTIHYSLGVILVGLVLLLLSIGIIGTLGHFGSLGHSWHLPAGLLVVSLVLASGWSATQIHPSRPWARTLHIRINIGLAIALGMVSLSGWLVVQKYLP